MPPTRQQAIADQIRARIRSGDLPPGSRLGTTGELQEDFEVSEIVIRGVIQTLTREDLLTSRMGPRAGYYVADWTVSSAVTDERYFPRPHSPVSHTTATYRAERVIASQEIRQRLRLHDEAVVVAIDSQFRDAAGEITHAVSTFEPLDIVGDTPAEVIGAGPAPDFPLADVIGRMRSIGLLTEQAWATEETQGRVATHDEANRLGISPGAAILHTVATVHDGQRPVSTTELFSPGARYIRVDRIRLTPVDADTTS